MPRRHAKRTLTTCCTAHTVHDGLSDVTYVLLPLLAQTFGLSLAQVGMIRSAHRVAMAAFQIPAGLFAERFGERNLLALGTAIAGAAFVALGYASGFWMILFALFFVFQNAIELRGTAFLWIPDLSRPDPLYVIPILMGISMFVLTKVGQVGMEPNPQMKMMLYFMPLMMTVMFLFFPSGLNLYYTVSNIASIPQQWLLGRERMKRTARAIVDVKTERPASDKGIPPKKRKKA